ncbi:MAG: hypothetical protein U1E60_00535 [Reyranellaceae bacterium]
MINVPPLAHVTLDTGDVRQCRRGEAREDLVALVRASLRRARLSCGTLEPVPRRDDYAYLATVERAGLLVTLVRNAADGPVPVLTFGVAGDDTYADLWALLHRRRSPMPSAIHQTEPGDPPRPPWLAVRLEDGAASVPAADLLWMAGFEQAMAWAWLDRVATGR